MYSTDDFEIAVDAFPWESEVQKEGFLHLVQYWKKFGLTTELPLQTLKNLTALFFIQKDHEASEYFRDMVGDQVHDIQDQIRKLQENNLELMHDVQNLKSLVESQKQTIDALLVAIKGGRS